ncbi:unnamed protein product [Acanthoscelides obtectus]|uniref:VWFA domain-containing protein n=3 Tax=Acanthoscelides obtectus TaxID=200917 RepID=A0A9P0LA86_ACAOB|nr:unnamed protein product [Acanthoscelides obtectus]CAK1660406.1 Voltage-dependent calcium channel subunit alpha-2/delta-3 [Acanthoscelides obtectus]
MRVIVVVFCLVCCVVANKQTRKDYERILSLVSHWSKEIGERLASLSETMTRIDQVQQSFDPLTDTLTKEKPELFLNKVATDIRIMMDTKAEAVSNIAEYAEFLSYHRKNESLDRFSKYYFFNADSINETSWDPERAADLEKEIRKSECRWACNQINVTHLPYNIFSNTTFRQHLFELRRHEKGISCLCEDWKKWKLSEEEYGYYHLPLIYDPRYQEYVNTNLSVVKIPLNVWDREKNVLEGVRWSEALDLIFKYNLEKDPTLTWQYFASPHGFMRHYPAIQWSGEQYNKTYDFRTRTWYTEAITSPKDIIILLDRSGSMKGTKRALSQQIVNQILDTLNDNDFVNIYTFTNSTEPLVDCFNDTLFQANEENLRLLRENLNVYDEAYAANLVLGFRKAFDILENFRHTGTSARCNQAIILITEGIDYDYPKEMFFEHNKDKDFPLRVFAFQIGQDPNDAKEMEWIACANMGYWGNMTHMGDIREKMLSYLNVMSRPINYNGKMPNKMNRNYIWSYLHVDLADRRLSNWLWKKFEGIRQREVFLEHIKNDMVKKKKKMPPNYVLLQTHHEYEKYEGKSAYKYMTTVSLPVYGRREDETELVGVAGIDVPLYNFKERIPYYRLGVNGYAFVVTNNGYILIHPEHRTEFENILKPTFNRVDILEVEVLDDDKEPRLFGDAVIKLRELLVNQNETIPITLNVKFPLNDMKRVVLSKRHYYYSKIGPFTLGIVLPDKYGFTKVDAGNIPRPNPVEKIYNALNNSTFWTVHPEWVYCQKCKVDQTPVEKVKTAFIKNEKSDLLNALFYDLVATSWFDSTDSGFKLYIEEYLISHIFLSTHSGLTRWKRFNFIDPIVEPFEKREVKAIEEDWYKRSVEFTYDQDMFIYSVPFETLANDTTTMITSTKAVFVGEGSSKTPVAVVGLQFNHMKMYEIYSDVVTKCEKGIENCKITCQIERLSCYILDNNAYVLVSDQPDYIGKYIGDIRPDIMADLIDDKVYIPTRMFDYQAICQKLPPKKIPEEERVRIRKEKQRAAARARKRAKSSATRFGLPDQLLQIGKWILTTVWFLFRVVSGEENFVYQSINEDMIAFNKQAIIKTLPTPCDQERWLFNLNKSVKFPLSRYIDPKIKFECDWPYVVDRIPNSNLIFLATNDHGPCKGRPAPTYLVDPKEIVYNTSLPCYIATMNNFTRRMYMDCFNRDKQEDALNQNDRKYCGHTWG